MKIGIDFDNTLAGYDRLFRDIALRQGWFSPSERATKNEIRDEVKRLKDGETKWRTMQAVAYGERMAEAELIAGAADFLGHCRKEGHEIFVVSHKSRYAAADSGKIDLRQAALGWMEKQNFFSHDGFALSRQRVFFEDSRVDKCQRIGKLECALFIDDLEEVFADPCFPRQVERILFHPALPPLPEGPFRVFTSWDAISRDVFGR
jgi:hypothetical protein